MEKNRRGAYRRIITNADADAFYDGFDDEDDDIFYDDQHAIELNELEENEKMSLEEMNG